MGSCDGLIDLTFTLFTVTVGGLIGLGIMIWAAVALVKYCLRRSVKAAL